MPILTQPTFGPRTALIYVTVGALVDVWTLVWYFTRDRAITHTEQFWVIGLCLTGITLLVLGLLLGHIGRAARRAELPPPEATAAEADIQKTAAANAIASSAAPAPAAPPIVIAQPGTPAPTASPPGTVRPQQPTIRVT